MVKNESGQAVTEYLLIVAVVVSFYLIVAKFISSSGLQTQLTTPITQNFAQAYQFGKPGVIGFVDGGPKDHPRMPSPGNNRLFINPVQGSAGGQ